MTATAPHSQIIARLVKERPITLVRDGKADTQALRKAHFGENDISELLGLNGLRGSVGGPRGAS